MSSFGVQTDQHHVTIRKRHNADTLWTSGNMTLLMFFGTDEMRCREDGLSMNQPLVQRRESECAQCKVFAARP